jgi:hypothetical protein
VSSSCSGCLQVFRRNVTLFTFIAYRCSETFVTTYKTAWRHKPENHNHLLLSRRIGLIPAGVLTSSYKKVLQGNMTS